MRILTRRRLARGGLAVVGIVVLMLSVVHPPAHAEEPEQEVTTSPGDPAGWEGTIATGTNTDYDAQTGEPCGDDVEDQCETVLLHVDVPDGYWDQRGGGLQVHLDDYLPNPASDFDLYIYRADADGSRGELVAQSADLPGMPETAEIKQASGDYLVQVVYFAVTASTYTATTEFVERDEPVVPPDVDNPLGLQDVLASDPDRGFRSHSEPHIAQSPTNPDLLIAGSKMYNRDPDSLAEYEFKVGTYVSFDGGRNWSDLGQTGVCPPSEAPPGSWPENDCYPNEDPDRAGTGDEDAAEPRTGGDYGEEYITSDPWVHFDDDGTAYLMVLDSPPFDSDTGWGMSFHRWRTPSPQDLESGQTWSDRIVINNYPDDLGKNAFLDDKNTFAVNNAGPDHDGKPGTMIACWGQNIVPLIKQQQVCERSTDGGKTWPGDPVPISGAQQLEIGVHVVADNADPDTFYAMWLHYVPGIVGAPDEMWLARTTNGGQTWQPPVLAAQLTGVPRQFPGQAFRNLSLPSMAAGPNAGELYAVYADYRPAQSEEDEDGMQADIMLITSSNGGMTWSSPVKVNTDDTDADQFQPAVAVTPAGQVNVSYFDRRHDPANLFIDTYLSRSNDGGASFTDVRVSHDMWDPRINPPISGSGEFIGDYQGLVVDNCAAIPFVNDTHLANERSREPRFDHGVPRSPYQEVVSWRVPNTHTYGGRPVPDTDCGG